MAGFLTDTNTCALVLVAVCIPRAMADGEVVDFVPVWAACIRESAGVELGKI
jgi:hypothetical protein